MTKKNRITISLSDKTYKIVEDLQKEQQEKLNNLFSEKLIYTKSNAIELIISEWFERGR